MRRKAKTSEINKQPLAIESMVVSSKDDCFGNWDRHDSECENCKDFSSCMVKTLKVTTDKVYFDMLDWHAVDWSKVVLKSSFEDAESDPDFKKVCDYVQRESKCIDRKTVEIKVINHVYFNN